MMPSAVHSPPAPDYTTTLTTHLLGAAPWFGSPRSPLSVAAQQWQLARAIRANLLPPCSRWIQSGGPSAVRRAPLRNEAQAPQPRFCLCPGVWEYLR